MMNNILIESANTTELVSVGNENDISYYIEKYMGMEFSNHVKEHYSKLMEKIKLERDIIKEENINYEFDLEEKNRLLHDTEESLTKLIERMENSKRMNKQTVIDKLKELKITIYNEL